MTGSEHSKCPPQLAVDGNGFVWRVYPTHWSMAPSSADNDPIAQPVTYYEPVEEPSGSETVPGSGNDPIDWLHDRPDNYRPDAYVSPKAVKVADRLTAIALDELGTFTYDYGYERIVVTRDTEIGISVQFLTSNSKRHTRS